MGSMRLLSRLRRRVSPPDPDAPAPAPVPPRAQRPPGAPTVPQRIGEPHVRPRADEDAIARGESIPRYPPGLRGLPAVSVDDLLADQADMIRSLDEALRLPHGQYETYILPVIEAYARYVHLLPASETHHHRGGGGLFRHGLEVAYHAARAAAGTVFAVEAERYRREPIWRAGTAIAGLVHDIGKPATDVTVSDREDTWRWMPSRQPLADALIAAGIRHYYLSWRADRHRQHEMHGPLMLQHCIPERTADWLSAADPQIYNHVLAATGGADKEGVVGRLVMRGEAISVREDLRASGYDPDAYALGVPVDRYLIDAMRALVRRGAWRCNTPGARLWHFDTGLHIVWQAGDELVAARDIGELIDEQGIPGVPRTPEKIAPLLIERGHIQTWEAHGDRHFLRPVTATCFKTDGKPATLWLVLLSSPALLYTQEPPPPLPMPPQDVARGNVGPKPAAAPCVADGGAAPPEPARTSAQSGPTATDSDDAAHPAPSPPPASSKPIRSAPAGTAIAGETHPTGPQPEAARAPVGSRHSEAGEPAQSPAASQQDGAKDAAVAWLGKRGRAGVIVRALIACQRAADTPAHARPWVHEGHVCWPWEAGLAVLRSTTPLAAARTLHDGGLTVIDPRRPAVRTREVAGQRAVMLTKPVSERVLVLTGPLPQHPTPADTSAPGVTSAQPPVPGPAPETLAPPSDAGASSPGPRASRTPTASSLAGSPRADTAEASVDTKPDAVPADARGKTPVALYAALREAVADGVIEARYTGDMETAERILIPRAAVDAMAAKTGLRPMIYRRRITLHAAVLAEGADLVLCPRLEGSAA